MKTAVFGGTFDPVHNGHIKMAQSAIEQFGLERLIVVPNANPPHKKNEVNTDFVHRYNMLRLAFSKNSAVEISDYESRPGNYYYSIYTMRYFRSVYGEDIGFIIGADSLCSIHKWHSYKEFIKENKLVVFSRQTDDEFTKVLSHYKDDGADICLADMPLVDVSSTSVRSLLKKGVIPHNVMPESVLDYIRSNALYGGKI